jgi:hypothetical protein
MAKPKVQIGFETELTRSSNDSGWHFLQVKKEIVARLGFETKAKRILCSINGTEPFPCALLPSGEQFYIIVNKTKRRALGINAGDKVRVELSKDESQYGLPMPEEFREVLDQDPEGDMLFHALTGGKQRTLLYYVGKWKDTDRRIHYALVMVEHLKRNSGKVLFPQLGEELKRQMY